MEYVFWTKQGPINSCTAEKRIACGELAFTIFGVSSQQLSTSLQQINDPRRSESGVEAFAILP